MANPNPLPRRLALSAATLAVGLAAGTGGYFLVRPIQGHAATSPTAAQLQRASLPTALDPASDPVTREAMERSRRYRMSQRNVRFDVFSGGLTTEKFVTLTFDDGPDPETTPEILDILKREHVPATFFVIGSKAERYPDLVRREAAEGHDLGNHTYHHFELTQLNAEAIRFEITRTNEALEKILGGPTRWFRGPGCHYTEDALQAIQDTHMVRVDTTDNSGDWDKYGIPSIMRRALGHLSNGDVILFHDRVPKTVELLPDFIRQVRRRGYTFVPLARLALRAQKNPDFKPAFWPDREGIRIDVAGMHPDPDPFAPAARPKSSSPLAAAHHAAKTAAAKLTPAPNQPEVPVAEPSEPAVPDAAPTEPPSTPSPTDGK